MPEANWEWVGSMVKGMGMCHKAKYKNDSILAWSLVNLVILPYFHTQFLET